LRHLEYLFAQQALSGQFRPENTVITLAKSVCHHRATKVLISMLAFCHPLDTVFFAAEVGNLNRFGTKYTFSSSRSSAHSLGKSGSRLRGPHFPIRCCKIDVSGHPALFSPLNVICRHITMMSKALRGPVKRRDNLGPIISRGTRCLRGAVGPQRKNFVLWVTRACLRPQHPSICCQGQTSKKVTRPGAGREGRRRSRYGSKSIKHGGILSMAQLRQG
jgi:hypothetical protein